MSSNLGVIVSIVDGADIHAVARDLIAHGMQNVNILETIGTITGEASDWQSLKLLPGVLSVEKSGIKYAI